MYAQGRRRRTDHDSTATTGRRRTAAASSPYFSGGPVLPFSSPGVPPEAYLPPEAQHYLRDMFNQFRNCKSPQDNGISIGDYRGYMAYNGETHLDAPRLPLPMMSHRSAAAAAAAPCLLLPSNNNDDNYLPVTSSSGSSDGSSALSSSSDIITTATAAASKKEEEERSSEEEEKEEIIPFPSNYTDYQKKKIISGAVRVLKATEAFVNKGDWTQITSATIATLDLVTNGSLSGVDEDLMAWMLLPSDSKRHRQLSTVGMPGYLATEPPVVLPVEAVREDSSCFLLKDETPVVGSVSWVLKDLPAATTTPGPSSSADAAAAAFVPPLPHHLQNPQAFLEWSKAYVRSEREFQRAMGVSVGLRPRVTPFVACQFLKYFECVVFSSLSLQAHEPESAVGTASSFDATQVISYKVTGDSFISMLGSTYSSAAFANRFLYSKTSCESVFTLLRSRQYTVREIDDRRAYCAATRIWSEENITRIHIKRAAKFQGNSSYAAFIRTIFGLYLDAMECACNPKKGVSSRKMFRDEAEREFRMLVVFVAATAKAAGYTSTFNALIGLMWDIMKQVPGHRQKVLDRIAKRTALQKLREEKNKAAPAADSLLLPLRKKRRLTRNDNSSASTSSNNISSSSSSAPLPPLPPIRVPGEVFPPPANPVYYNETSDTSVISWKRAVLCSTYGKDVFMLMYDAIKHPPPPSPSLTNSIRPDIADKLGIRTEFSDAERWCLSSLAGLADCILFQHAESRFIMKGHFDSTLFISCPYRYILPIACWNLIIPMLSVGSRLPVYYESPLRILQREIVSDKHATATIAAAGNGGAGGPGDRSAKRYHQYRDLFSSDYVEKNRPTGGQSVINPIVTSYQ